VVARTQMVGHAQISHTGDQGIKARLVEARLIFSVGPEPSCPRGNTHNTTHNTTHACVSSVPISCLVARREAACGARTGKGNGGAVLKAGTIEGRVGIAQRRGRALAHQLGRAADHELGVHNPVSVCE
jgi:hypothetical protein